MNNSIQNVCENGFGVALHSILPTVNYEEN